MAKLTRNSYKRKIIVFGLMVFMAIALVSTGFAAWIMSTNANKEQSGNVTVGKVSDSSLDIKEIKLLAPDGTDITEKASFKFEPTKDDNTGRVRWDKNDDHAEFMEMTISGKVTPEDYLGIFKVTLQLPIGVVKAITNKYIALPEEWTLDEEKNIATQVIDKTSMEKVENTKELKFSCTLKFLWGEKFGNQNPGIYYDDNADGKKVTNEIVKQTLREFRATLHNLENWDPETIDNLDLDTTNPLVFKVILEAIAN